VENTDRQQCVWAATTHLYISYFNKYPTSGIANFASS